MIELKFGEVWWKYEEIWFLIFRWIVGV
jgi:hypothetical protein